MRVTFPHGSHITRKRGIYHYRRRLPVGHEGEVTLSLATRRFREAEHLGGVLDAAFDWAWAKARAEVSGSVDIQAALRGYLRKALDGDATGTSAPSLVGIDTTKSPDITDLIAQRRRAAAAASTRDTASVAITAYRLMAEHDIPISEHYRMALGVLEANLRHAEEALRRAKGEPPAFDAETEIPAFTMPDEAPGEVTPPVQYTAPKAAPTGPTRSGPPLASSLVEPFFVRRSEVDRATHQVMGQERGTLRRFIESAGDRPIDRYSRGDITAFLDTLRRLPNNYGKSPRDKDRTLAEIIAEADANDAPRVVDKTVKRHLTALSQFFQYAVDRGHLTVTARSDLVDSHRFREGGAARNQRDAWTPDELTALFGSPIWRGCHPIMRSQKGADIIRDAKFWLPLLALFHGARLEEFADLYQRDVACDEGVWCLRITETEDRRLKTNNAERVLPLHQELIRLGFLDYVQHTAPRPNDPLFPDLEPQGDDNKRGPRFTRFFVNYRKAIGLYREGVGMHAFRHTANTRLRDTIRDFQQIRHVNYLFGHAQGGGEGGERYDKGPGLKAVAETLALLQYPELDLSHLYVTTAAEEPPEAA